MTAITGGSIYATVRAVLAHKRSMQGHTSGDGPRVSEIADRTEMIEDRLRVLERLATDRGALLADEIEALRDQRREREQG